MLQMSARVDLDNAQPQDLDGVNHLGLLVA
jgi:hypothetical protein